MSVSPPAASEIHAARARIEGIALRTPLVPLDVPTHGPRILLKLECLQPIGAFKIRGAANAMLLAGPERLRDGVYTASAGNMAQGVAWVARRLGIACKVVVPASAPRAKTDAVERLGGEVVRVPFDEWWQTMVDHGHPDIGGYFVHPVADPAVIAGNGTIGLEILDDAPGVDAIVVPFGGGGLSCGIAAAVRDVNPAVRVFAAEAETAAPLAASLRAGRAVTIDAIPSFVDGIGGKAVFPEMWPIASSLLAGSLVASLDEIAQAIRLLAERNRVIAEGAGGASVAAALNRPIDARTIACVVSGGNLDLDVLASILTGNVPKTMRN